MQNAINGPAVSWGPNTPPIDKITRPICWAYKLHIWAQILRDHPLTVDGFDRRIVQSSKYGVQTIGSVQIKIIINI
jgi:hypothetical protein